MCPALQEQIFPKMVAQPGLTTTFLVVSLCKVSLGEVQASGPIVALPASHTRLRSKVRMWCKAVRS